MKTRNTKKTILIVDDEMDILGALSFFLSRKGIGVLTAGNGREALSILQESVNRPDLIILDGNMPVMNGKEFLIERRAKDIQPATPVLLVSAEAWETNEFMVVGHISKPFDLMSFLDLVDFYLKQVSDDSLTVIK